VIKRLMAWQTANVVGVYRVVEWRNERIYRTEFLGYDWDTRPKQPNETYAPVSTKITSHPDADGEVELTPWIGK